MRVVSALTFAMLAAALVAGAPPRWHELSNSYSFDQYVEDQGKGYRKDSLEYTKREKLFRAGLNKVLAHNADPTRTWNMGVNRFTDRTPQELKNLNGGRQEPNFVPKHGGKFEKKFRAQGLVVPQSLDYRLANPPILTAVKDQGYCGDCWAHAVTEAIESSYARSSGNLLVLSQQQITSCTPAESSCWSCNGMYPRYAYEYASSAKYIMEEWVYPFTSYTGNNPACLNITNPAYPLQTTVNVQGYIQLPFNDQTAIVEALNTLGPLSILVDAGAWNAYESGVFNNCTYNAQFGLDHAVLLVGYGTDSKTGLDYWIVRNSWSGSWGEHGYIRLQKNAVPLCGLNQGGMSCFSNNNNTQATPSCGQCGVLSDAQFPLMSL